MDIDLHRTVCVKAGCLLYAEGVAVPYPAAQDRREMVVVCVAVGTLVDVLVDGDYAGVRAFVYGEVGELYLKLLCGDICRVCGIICEMRVEHYIAIVLRGPECYLRTSEVVAD